MSSRPHKCLGNIPMDVPTHAWDKKSRPAKRTKLIEEIKKILSSNETYAQQNMALFALQRNPDLDLEERATIVSSAQLWLRNHRNKSGTWAPPESNLPSSSVAKRTKLIQEIKKIFSSKQTYTQKNIALVAYNATFMTLGAHLGTPSSRLLFHG